jgi:uncharacterized protein (DUF1800 family)
MGAGLAGDRSLIAHLFRRAGFGAKPAELDHYQAAGYEAAVEDLLGGAPLMGGRPSSAETLDPLQEPANNLVGRAVARALLDIQTEWVTRMVTSTVPLVERMTLFLHDHFATAYVPGDTVDTQELTAQNSVFRRHALGNWKALCHAMLEDVALSAWLDNNVNVKKHPNENLARELMELFTLGVGNYTETDVREAARALTGYQIGYNLEPRGPRNVMVFNAALHDEGTKTILGKTGKFLPHDVIDIVLARPAAPRFLATKLIETFVAPSPAASFVEDVAQALIAGGWELRPALRAIFTAPEFKASAARGAIVKTPAEFLVGAFRALGRTEGDLMQAGALWMAQAGQALYDPPNVGGWPHNEGWLGAGQLLARYNAGAMLADKHVAAFVLPGSSAVGATNVAAWGEVFGITDLSPATTAALQGYIDQADDATPQSLAAAMITLVVASPDFIVA